MRGLLMVVVGMQGCAYVEGMGGGEDLAMRSLSTLYVEARGLELTPDGSTGLVGMNTTTCAFDSAFGMTSSDYDVAGSSDTVEAADCGPDSVCDYAVVSGDKVSVVQPDDSFWGTVPSDRRFRGLVDTTLVTGGLAVLSDRDGSCIVEFAGRRTLETRSSVAMPAEACVGAVVEAGEGGTMFVAADDGLYAVDASGQTRIAPGADRIAWDATSAILYAADRDGTVVRALEADGALLWKQDLGGTVVALDDAGERGAVLVMVEDGPDQGRMVLLDGVKGRVAMEEPTPGTARALRVSGDGQRVAVVREAEVMFFALETAADAAAEDEAFELDLGELDL